MYSYIHFSHTDKTFMLAYSTLTGRGEMGEGGWKEEPNSSRVLDRRDIMTKSWINELAHNITVQSWNLFSDFVALQNFFLSFWCSIIYAMHKKSQCFFPFLWNAWLFNNFIHFTYIWTNLKLTLSTCPCGESWSSTWKSIRNKHL